MSKSIFKGWGETHQPRKALLNNTVYKCHVKLANGGVSSLGEGWSFRAQAPLQRRPCHKFTLYPIGPFLSLLNILALLLIYINSCLCARARNVCMHVGVYLHVYLCVKESVCACMLFPLDGGVWGLKTLLLSSSYQCKGCFTAPVP